MLAWLARGVASLVQVCACPRYRYTQRELEQGQRTLLSWGKMDYKYGKLLRGIETEGEGGGKREKDVELPRHVRQLTTSCWQDFYAKTKSQYTFTVWLGFANQR